MVEEGDWAGMKTFHDRLTEYLRLYYFVGGMPEVVSTYAATRDYAAVRELQQELLENCERDFSKHVSTGTAAKIGRIWDSIPLQLARENKRFMYGEVKKGARAKELEDAMDWLLRAELGISPCYWLSETSHAEIDFLFQHGMDVVPVEVKAEINLQAKSLKSYCKRFSPPRAVRTSMARFRVSQMAEGPTLVDLPLYAVCRMRAELGAAE